MRSIKPLSYDDIHVTERVGWTIANYDFAGELIEGSIKLHPVPAHDILENSVNMSPISSHNKWVFPLRRAKPVTKMPVSCVHDSCLEPSALIEVICNVASHGQP